MKRKRSEKIGDAASGFGRHSAMYDGGGAALSYPMISEQAHSSFLGVCNERSIILELELGFRLKQKCMRLIFLVILTILLAYTSTNLYSTVKTASKKSHQSQAFETGGRGGPGMYGVFITLK